MLTFSEEVQGKLLHEDSPFFSFVGGGLLLFLFFFYVYVFVLIGLIYFLLVHEALDTLTHTQTHIINKTLAHLEFYYLP